MTIYEYLSPDEIAVLDAYDADARKCDQLLDRLHRAELVQKSAPEVIRKVHYSDPQPAQPHNDSTTFDDDTPLVWKHALQLLDIVGTQIGKNLKPVDDEIASLRTRVAALENQITLLLDGKVTTLKSKTHAA